MRLFSFAISVLLHGVLLGLAVYIAKASPAPLPGRPVYTVDLLAPVPLGMPDSPPLDAAAQAPAAPAVAPEPPQIEPVPAPEPPTVVPVPVPEPPKPEPVLIPEPPKPEPPKPEPPKPEPEPAKPEPEPAKPEPPKPAPPKPEPPKPKPPKPKPTPPKPEPPKPRQPSAQDILRDALADVQRVSTAQKPSDPVAGALEDLRNPQLPAGTPEGIPGGTGASGAAGIENVYIAQIIAAVRPNWKSAPQARRQDLSVVVRIDLSPSGDVLRSRIVSTSGDARVDSSALDAIAATGTLPPPPNADMRSLDVTFRLSDMDSGMS